MLISRQVGTVSTHINVFVPNATVSTGAGLANIVASTVTLAWYRSDSSGVSSWTLTSGTLGTFSASTFTQASSTVALGWYQVALPDSLFASGDHAVVHLSGAASMAPVPVLIELTKTDNQSYLSTQTVKVGAPVAVSSISIPVGVSSIATPVTASSVTAGVNVSSIVGTAAVTSAAGVLTAGVSSVGAVASVTAPVGVSTVTAAGLADFFDTASGLVFADAVTSSVVYEIATNATATVGLVGVSSISIPVGVSSIATPVTASSVTRLTGVSTVTIPVGVSTGSIAVSSATAGVNEGIADALLLRNVSSGANTGRTVREALYVLRNKVDAGLGIVYNTDDTASSWAFQVSTVAGDPIQVIDPA
jgi:hypothetical protein